MISKIFQLSLLSLIISYVKCDDLNYCYDKDGNPYQLFSTWTPRSKAWMHMESKEYDCKPIYVWGLLKHGIKSITDRQIKSSENLWNVKLDIEKNKKENRCALCEEDYYNLLSSSAKFTLYKEQNVNLAEEALNSHDLFGYHLKKLMESSPVFTFSIKDVEIQTNGAKETKKSAMKFAKSFLKDSKEQDIKENKEFLEMRSNCANWKANNKEAKDFISSPLVESMRLEISYRLGFTYGLPMETIITMYESCVFWNILAVFHKPPFCAAFSPAHLKIMEYWKDLEHYYEFGYGNKLSEEMGCWLVRDMIGKLTTASTSTWEKKNGIATTSQWTGKRVNIYFADEENVMGMITKMGLYRDEEAPKHDNYHIQKTKRKWRSSLISPMDASVHAVLYTCKNDEKMVEFYHNHDVVKFEACKTYQDGKCPLQTFFNEVKKNFKNDIYCELEYCGSFPKKPSASGSNTVSYNFIVMIVCFLLIRLHCL